MSKFTFVVLATLGVGAGLGWIVRGVGEEAQPRVLSEPSPSKELASLASASNAPGVNLAQLRNVVREELAAALLSASARPASTPDAVKPPPASAELVAKRRAAVEEIESMISSGKWGNEQRATFHQSMALVDPEQAARLLHEVTIAINEGTVQLSTDGPPL